MKLKRIIVVLTMGALFVALMAFSALPSFGAPDGPCTNKGCKTTAVPEPFSPSGNTNAKQNFTSTDTVAQQNSFNGNARVRSTAEEDPCGPPFGPCR